MALSPTGGWGGTPPPRQPAGPQPGRGPKAFLCLWVSWPAPATRSSCPSITALSTGATHQVTPHRGRALRAFPEHPRDERGQRPETQRSVKPESYTCSDQPPSPTPATARQGRESLGHGEAAAAVDGRRSCGLRATPAWRGHSQEALVVASDRQGGACQIPADSRHAHRPAGPPQVTEPPQQRPQGRGRPTPVARDTACRQEGGAHAAGGRGVCCSGLCWAVHGRVPALGTILGVVRPL